jgi:predicted lactoylglutathione lyase
MKKKIAIIGAVALAVIAVATWAIPSFAAGTSVPAPAAGQTQQVNKARVMVRLLIVQDGTKVDAFLAKAQAAGKITAAQVTQIKTMWDNNHAQFAPGKPVLRILRAQNGANVKTFLDKAVAAGKLQSAQETNVLNLWHQLHGK